MNELWLKAECLQPYELLSRKRLNMNYRLRRYELFAKGECDIY